MAEQQIAPPGWQGQWPPAYNGMEEVAGMAYEGLPPGYGSDKSPAPNEPQDGDNSSSKPPPMDLYQLMLDAEAQKVFVPKPLAYPPKTEAQNSFTPNQVPYHCSSKGESSVRHASPVASPSKPAPMNASDWQPTFFTGETGRCCNEAEVISSVSFDPTGKHLAVGNKGGRIAIYSRRESLSSNQIPQASVYTPFTDFQSHSPEFDYLKSVEVEEKINQIKWCQPSNGSQSLLSTNDKTIKLWRIHEHAVCQITTYNEQGLAHVPHERITPEQIRLPKREVRSKTTTSTIKRVYANAHMYHINSIAINSDGETFMSADDLRVNLWSLGVSNQSFNIVDIKPANMEELTEVITAADFHPTHCNTMMYSTSRGAIKLGDMRQSALCDAYSQVFEEQEDPEARSFFSEIIASISDIKFSPDGRYIIARDFLTLKVWDINMNSRPVQTINIHEHLRPRLGDLYESDCIFDKFECAVSGDGNNFITGSYNSEFHIYDRYGRADISITPRTARVSRRHSMPQRGLAQQIAALPTPGDPDALDFSKKIMQASWHPSLNEVAVSIRNSLFVYAA